MPGYLPADPDEQSRHEPSVAIAKTPIDPDKHCPVADVAIGTADISESDLSLSERVWREADARFKRGWS
jgi:hypothetical protein